MKLIVFSIAPLLACAQSIRLDELSRLELQGVEAKTVSWKGSSALRLTEPAANQGEAVATLRGLTIHNGRIDVDVAGAPGAGAAEAARGFIGIAFRILDGGKRFECLYIRPTNGRATDQLRRNHSAQYVSFPDWPWERLRKELPGVYESYADMTAGEWIHLRIVIEGANASLYVGGASQPCLLVHDLKLGDVIGGLGLWIGPGTDGCFETSQFRFDRTRVYLTVHWVFTCHFAVKSLWNCTPSGNQGHGLRRQSFELMSRSDGCGGTD